jgi:hypothetical protein
MIIECKIPDGKTLKVFNENKLVAGVLILKKKYRAILLKENENKTLLNN